MTYSRVLLHAVVAIGAAMSLCGCIFDSIEPWLQEDSVLQYELDLEGDWKLINDDYTDKYTVTLEKKKDRRSIDNQSFYIKVSPINYQNRFHFSADVHEVNGIKLVQIENFSHYHGEVFRLANRETLSLWQIAYDEDNIILWAPSFPRESPLPIKTMQDSNDKPLFIDSTENLRNYIQEWTNAYSETKETIDMILPIILTRKDTEFRMPSEMKDLVPRVYESYLKQFPEQSDSPVEK